MLFFLDNLQIYQMSVSLQRVFHSIRFKVNKGWSTAVLLFFMPMHFIRFFFGTIFFTLQCLLPPFPLFIACFNGNHNVSRIQKQL